MDGGVGDERDGEQCLGRRQPEVAHHHHHGVVVDVEEGQPAGAGTAEEDQEGVAELENLGEVEDVGPEESGPARRGAAGREADRPSPAGIGDLVEDGEGAADGHDEGEKEHGEAVRGGDEAEGGGGEGREEVKSVES